MKTVRRMEHCWWLASPRSSVQNLFSKTIQWVFCFPLLRWWNLPPLSVKLYSQLLSWKISQPWMQKQCLWSLCITLWGAFCPRRAAVWKHIFMQRPLPWESSLELGLSYSSFFFAAMAAAISNCFQNLLFSLAAFFFVLKFKNIEGFAQFFGTQFVYICRS